MAEIRTSPTFADAFRELRLRRRLPMTTWEPAISSPYINDVEKKGLLPGEEKLDELTRVFVEVAREQGAADPEADARLLRRERERCYLTQRAKLDPQLVELYMVTRHAVGPDRERARLVKTLKRTVEAVSELPRNDRDQLLAELQNILDQFAPTPSSSAD